MEEKQSKDDKIPKENDDKQAEKETASASRGSRYLQDRRESFPEQVRRMMWADKVRRTLKSRVHKGQVTHQVSFPDTFHGLYSLRYSPDSQDIIAGFGAGVIQIYSSSNGELKNTMRNPMGAHLPVTSIRFHPKLADTFYASSACGTVFQCNSGNNEFYRIIEEEDNEINSIDVKAEGDILATGGKDTGVRLYDTVTLKMICEYVKPDIPLEFEHLEFLHTMRVLAVRFHPQYTSLCVTGGWDDTCKIWDVRVPDGCVRTIYGPHICGEAIDLKDKVVLTGSWVAHESLQLWDITSAKLIETINPVNRPATLDGEFLYTVQYFSGDVYGNLVLAGGSGVGAVELISIKDKMVVGSFPADQPVQALDSHGNHLCYGGTDTFLKLGEYV